MRGAYAKVPTEAHRGVQTCRVALLLGGGGGAGAFALGVLQSFFEMMRDEGVVPVIQLAHGVSIGGIWSGAFAFYDQTNGHKAVERCIALMKQSTRRSCLFGIPNPLFCMDKSLLSADQLKRLLLKEFKEADYKKHRDGRSIAMFSTNITRGCTDVFNNTQDYSGFVEGMMATSAIPLVLPDVRVGDEVYSDGGVMRILPRLPEELQTYEFDYVLVIPCQPATLRDVESVDLSTSMGTASRCAGLNVSNMAIRNVAEIKCELATVKAHMSEMTGGAVNTRLLVVGPTESLPHPMRGMTRDDVDDLIAHGKECFLSAWRDVGGWEMSAALQTVPTRGGRPPPPPPPSDGSLRL